MKTIAFLTILILLVNYLNARPQDTFKAKGCACVDEDSSGKCLQWVCGKREIYNTANKGCACVDEDPSGKCLQWVCG